MNSETFDDRSICTGRDDKNDEDDDNNDEDDDNNDCDKEMEIMDDAAAGRCADRDVRSKKVV